MLQKLVILLKHHKQTRQPIQQPIQPQLFALPIKYLKHKQTDVFVIQKAFFIIINVSNAHFPHLKTLF